MANDKGETTTSPFFASIYPRLKDIPGLFGAGTAEVNIEELARNRPDVVFVTPSSKGAIEPLATIGVPAVMIASFQNPDQLKAGMTMIADVLGDQAPARAQRFAEYFDGNVARAEMVTADIPAADRPKVYYTAGSPLQTEGKGSIVDAWMRQAGARNVAAENGISTPPTFATVTVEDVLAWNPDFIICRDPKTRQQILTDPRWQQIAAVRNNRVIVNPAGVFVWSVRSGESALQPLWAAQTFHPDRFKDLDMRKEVRDFYQRFYSYTISGQQIDKILHPPQP